MIDEKTGTIIWHDFLTGDRQRATAFYQGLAGWSYQTEHATDFAWGGGEKDFILALDGDEAGAGFAETPPEMTNGWIAYVEVLDVDATVAQAEKLEGTIVRLPFEVPGVGRNALLRDPLGALIGVSISRHNYPVPRRQFGLEVYLTNAPSFPEEFYSQLFDWTISSQPVAEPAGQTVTGPSGDDVAVVVSGTPPKDVQAVWVPSIKVADPTTSLKDATALGGERFNASTARQAQQHGSFMRDPDGALSCLLKA